MGILGARVSANTLLTRLYHCIAGTGIVICLGVICNAWTGLKSVRRVGTILRYHFGRMVFR